MTATMDEPVTETTAGPSQPPAPEPARFNVKNALVLAAVFFGAFALGQLASLIGGAHHRLVPLPVQIQALALGCVNALFAMGIVLIYRSNRIINFAHAGFGGAGAVTYLVLTREYGIPYAVALPAGVLTAALLGILVEALLIRRFIRSTRLVLTVVTIGVAQLLQALVLPVIDLTGARPERIFGRFDSPLSHFKWNWFPVIFTGDQIVLAGVTVVVMIGLAAFFKRSSIGIAVRAAAENDDRANLLGVNTRTLATFVWMMAALLSGLAATLQVPLSGLPSEGATGVGSSLLLRALAAAVFARFESLPMVVVAALGINVFEQSIFFGFGRTDIVDAAVFAVILIGLLLQRKKLARSQLGESGTWSATEEIRPVPPELAPLPAVRKGARYAMLVGSILALGYPWVASPSQTNQGSLFLIYGIVAVSLVILIGWGGQISLGQWGIAGVGALVGGALTARGHVWFPLALLLGSMAGAAVAVLLGLPALRIRGLFLAVTTLAFAVVVSSVLLSDRYFGWLIPNVVNRPKFAFINTEDERAFYYLCMLGLMLAVLAAQGLRRSRTGRVLIAMRDNERTAQAFGVNLVRTRLATFAISGFLAAFAGVLFAHHQHAVNQEAFLPAESIQMFLMAVIGGLGSVTGVLLGPLYLGLTTVFLTSYRLLASGVGVLFVLLLVPGGFGSLAYAVRDSFLRRVAIRNRIFVPSLLADYAADGQMSRTPLAPKFDQNGEKAEIPVRYRRVSRIGVAGTSQTEREWSL